MSKDEFEANNEAATALAVPNSIEGLRERELPRRHPGERTEPSVETAPESMLLDGLSEEVKKNIVGYDRLELEQMILKILSFPGAVYTTNRIILILAHKYKRTDARAAVLARIRALVTQGAVVKVPNKLGTYSITDAGRAALGIL